MICPSSALPARPAHPSPEPKDARLAQNRLQMLKLPRCTASVSRA
jgi:hypothetical protein